MTGCAQPPRLNYALIEVSRTGTDFAAGTLLRSAWCQIGISALHFG